VIGPATDSHPSGAGNTGSSHVPSVPGLCRMSVVPSGKFFLATYGCPGRHLCRRYPSPLTLVNRNLTFLPPDSVLELDWWVAGKDNSVQTSPNHQLLQALEISRWLAVSNSNASSETVSTLTLSAAVFCGRISLALVLS